MNATSPASIAASVWASKPLPHKALGALIATAFVLQALPADATAGTALGQSLLAGLATALGALLLTTMQRPSPSAIGIAMAVAAGAMSMAAIVTLLMPAWQHAAASPGLTVITLATGALIMFGLDRALPHEHPCAESTSAAASGTRRAAWLLVAAITLHNLPEGFAVGAAAVGGDSAVAAMAIALQNIPEGLIVAAVLWAAGLTRGVAIAIAAGSGLAEPFGALLGIGWVGKIPSAAPSAMALAAGAMLFVIAHELLPAAARQLSAWRIGCYFLGGFATMTIASQLL